MSLISWRPLTVRLRGNLLLFGLSATGHLLLFHRLCVHPFTFLLSGNLLYFPLPAIFSIFCSLVIFLVCNCLDFYFLQTQPDTHFVYIRGTETLRSVSKTDKNLEGRYDIAYRYIRSGHNHQFDYSSTITCRLCVSMPSAVKPSRLERWIWGSLTCATMHLSVFCAH